MWHCANGCGRQHDRDTTEPEVCEVCRLEAERDEAIARGVRLWEWAAENEVWHDALSALQDAEQAELFNVQRERDEAQEEAQCYLLAAEWLAERAAGYDPDRAARLLQQAVNQPLPWDHDGSGDINSAAELEHYAAGIHAWEGEEE